MDCCEFGKDIRDPHRILHQTRNFIVTPSKGPIGIEGYLLICSKEHFASMGDLPLELYDELERVLSNTSETLLREYGAAINIFEHGPRRGSSKGGCCVDHAHLHIVSHLYKDITPFLIEHHPNRKKIEKLKELKICPKDKSYLYFESWRGGYMFIVDVVPSQYLRQILAVEAGRPEMWDWRQHPDMETFNKTLERLKGKF